MAVWMPVTVVPTSLATVAMDTFMTELSRVIRNWPAARVSRTSPVPLAGASGARVLMASASLPSPHHLRLVALLGGQLAVASGGAWHIAAVRLASCRADDEPMAALDLTKLPELDHHLSRDPLPPRCESAWFSPAVPPACHKQRSRAVSSGQP